MYACLDIGGTSIKVAVSDKNGNLSNQENLIVSHEVGEFTEAIINWVEKIKKDYDIKGVAISSPGAVNTKSGIVGGASAVPCIHGPNWKKILNKKLNINISIENDANCAALAELFNGTAKDLKDVLFVVCGSGIGGSIIKNGEIHHGKHLYGGEFGFMLMEESDGEFKNFSEVASTMSFVRKVREYYNDNSWTGEKIFEEANNGNEFCSKAIETFYMNLAKGIFNLQYIYDPEIILLGGAISCREDFIKNINKKLEYLLSKISIAEIMPLIDTCTYKKDANIIGALAHHLKEYSKI